MSPNPAGGPTRSQIEDLFRQHHNRIVAALVRKFGTSNLGGVEDATQDAFRRAVETWPAGETPRDPAGWLYVVARNRIVDRLRREGAERQLDLVGPERDAADADPDWTDPATIADDELRLVFLCCHPALSPPARVALALNLAGGFAPGEIAAAFFESTENVYQRLHRARRRLASLDEPFVLPAAHELSGRLSAVLDTIYLVFNDGYSCRDLPEVFRAELVDEAIRLARLLGRSEIVNDPAVEALLALLLFQSSRLRARLVDGRLVPLAGQDRTQWDAQRIAEGLDALERAGRGEVLSDYHILAGIAACHATARTWEATDWARILDLYGLLTEDRHDDWLALNRAIAVAEVHGATEGLTLLDSIDAPAVANHPLAIGTRAELLARSGAAPAAAVEFKRAARAAASAAEAAHFDQRAQSLSRS